MLDFVKISGIIPSEGTLSLTMSKIKDGRIVVCYAPKFKDKNHEEFSPITLAGTPEELNAEFSAAIADIAKQQEKLYWLLKVSTVVSKKKASITKAVAAEEQKVAKSGSADVKADVKTDTVKPTQFDLFSAPPVKQTPDTPVETKPVPVKEKEEEIEIEEDLL